MDAVIHASFRFFRFGHVRLPLIEIKYSALGTQPAPDVHCAMRMPCAGLGVVVDVEVFVTEGIGFATGLLVLV